MKVYNAQRLSDYDIESIGIYDSLDKAMQDLLDTSSDYDLMFIDEQELNSMQEGKRIWDCDYIGVETFYA